MSKILKPGLSLDVHTPAYGGGIGETFYRICDSVGLVFETIFPDRLGPFYQEQSDA